MPLWCKGRVGIRRIYLFFRDFAMCLCHCGLFQHYILWLQELGPQLKKSLFWSPPGPIVLLPFLEWHQKSLLLFFLFFFPMSSFFKPIRTFCRFLRRGLEKQMCSSSIPFEKWTSIKVLEINWIWLGKDILQYPISIIAPQCLNLQEKSHFQTLF